MILESKQVRHLYPKPPLNTYMMTTGPFLEDNKAAPLRWMCWELLHRFLEIALCFEHPRACCAGRRGGGSQKQCCVFSILHFVDRSNPNVSKAALCHCIFYVVQWLLVQARQWALGWRQGGATGPHRDAGVQPASDCPGLEPIFTPTVKWCSATFSLLFFFF